MLLHDLEAFEAVRPLDRFEAEYPAQWFGRSRKHPRRFVLGLFNFGEAYAVQTVDLARAVGGPVSGLGAKEYWSGEDLGGCADVLTRQMAPHSCQILLLEPRAN